MLYILVVILAVLGAAYFLTGSISLRARDKHAIRHYDDDAYAQQTMNHLSHHNHNPF
ncbi:hypothetical protein [Brevibacillus agri]|uniref:hypothetical protein n=1 Tax=Brevibacillus agri TaxID=51101 RepID=UPI003D1FB41F